MLGWLGRTGLLYLLLCAAIAFYLFAWPAISARLSNEDFRQDAMSIAEVRTRLIADRDAAQARLADRVDTIRSASAETIADRLEAARAERAALAAELAEGEGWLDRIRPSRILERKRRELQLAALETEIAALEVARERRAREAALDRARNQLEGYARIPTAAAVEISQRLCSRARAALAQYDRQEPIERNLRTIFLREREPLVEREDTLCEQARDRKVRRDRGLAAASSVREARARLQAIEDFTLAALPDPTTDLSDTTVRDVMMRAALALLAILLMPFAIRTLFYYVLAPSAERRPPIRLIRDGTLPATIATGKRSGPSLQIELGDNEELLVRQGYLQSSQSGATMRTQWLLSWRNPLTSLASGMAFLTAARGRGAMFGISARADPFAEIARIDLAKGAALVLQPRALAAVVQPIAAPLKIESRWRLFSLHAWLTFQFRYLVFHGPASMIVKGGRGVRVEPARAGRVFGQDQLLGFSARLAYAIRRNETFQPYLFGKEPLFRDRVADTEPDAGGVLVIEEAPMAGKRGGVRAGLENAFDAVLKAFGI
ncbi:hypothetical protein E3U23_08195 [Erythrobacter litoralis]|nr:hypothetical protein [Erythrobacter litoralis]